MYLNKFVNSETGRYLMSILLGIGLATLFRQICEGKNWKVGSGKSFILKKG